MQNKPTIYDLIYEEDVEEDYSCPICHCEHPDFLYWSNKKKKFVGCDRCIEKEKN